MKNDRINEGRFSEHGHGLGTVTEEMVQQRAAELALISGRPGNVLSTDLDQAHRELTGEERLNPEPSPAEELPEEARWEEVPESTGKKVPVVPASDEQTFAEKLVEEGVEDAEQDQMVKATKAERRRDKAA